MTKRRRGGRPQATRRRAPDKPDDLTETPFGYMARWGRFISMQGTLSPEEHAETVAAFIASGPVMRQQQETRRSRLLEILRDADAVDLLARASLTYLQINPDSFKEWESDRSPAHIEYLALQVLGLGQLDPKVVDPMLQSSLTSEAVELVREMFRSASMLIIENAVESRRRNPDDPISEYALKTRLESLGVRGTGYTEHLKRVIQGCLGPFADECRDVLGFTAMDALALTYAMADVVSDRIEPLATEAAAGRRETLRQLKSERRHRSRADRHLPDWLLDLPPSEAKMHVSMLTTMWLFADSRSLALVTADDLAEHTGIDVNACAAFLRAFACPPELFNAKHHSYPGGAHPLTVQPLIEVAAGSYLMAVPSSMIDAIRPRMEDLLAEAQAWERYLNGRGKYLEREATALLASALPGSKAWVGIPWQSSTDSSDLDGLVADDDVTIRLQCKAGRLTAPARRGAPGRMKRDVGDLIERAAQQHGALAVAIETEGAQEIGFSHEQAISFESRLQFEAIVCIDDLTVWATETHGLRRFGALPHDRHIPWVLSLTDLMAVVDLIQGAELVHYLVRRQRIERDGRIEAHDELDWVGHYLAEGLFFDRYFDTESPPQVFRLLSYTEPIDAWYFIRAGLRTSAAPKPSQGIPRSLLALIRRLETERPPHWVLAAIAFLDGDGKSRKLWAAAIENARNRVAQMGWSNASQVFDGRLGVTLMIDLRVDWPEIRARVANYCRRKADETRQPNWIGVGEGASGGLFVLLIEQVPDAPVADVFLEPPPKVPEGRTQDDPPPSTVARLHTRSAPLAHHRSRSPTFAS